MWAGNPAETAASASRGPTLRTWLRDAGYAEVWARSALIERWAPFRPVEQEFWRGALRYVAGRALHLDLLSAELAFWRELSKLARAAAFVARPDFYGRGVQTVAVG